MSNTANTKVVAISVNNTDLQPGMEIVLPSGGALTIDGEVYRSNVSPGLMAVETEVGALYLDAEASVNVLGPDQEPSSYHHLMLVNDGERVINQLFHSERDRAEHLIAALRSQEIDIELDDVNAAIQEADDDAAGADHPEGAQPRAARPEEYLDTLGDLLSAKGFDMYLDTLRIQP